MRIEPDRSGLGPYSTMRKLIVERYGPNFTYLDVADTYRDTFGPYAWPGGYPLLFIDNHGRTLCHECAKKAHVIDNEPVTVDIYAEGPPIQCNHCGTVIESAYGDPDDDNDKDPTQ